MGPNTSQLESKPTPGSAKHAALALLLLVPAPTLGVLCAMHWFPDTWYGQAVHFGAKAWLLGLPILWLVYVQRIKPRLPRWSWKGMPAALITGLLIVAVIVGTWELFAYRMVDVSVFQQKMTDIGLSTPAIFLLFAAAVTFINALLEEYVWRWFVYDKWLELLGGKARAIAIPGAIVLAGLCFTLHHTVAMSVYFGWQANALASLGVFIGGVTWSILYMKYKNIYAAYVSHIFADIALFYVGYQVAFG